MSSFQGYVSDPDNLEEWAEANALTIATTEGIAADQETEVPLVLVEASYKPGGDSKHPVRLTIADTIRAAASLVSTAHDSLNETSFALEETHDAKALLGLLGRLTEVDEAVWELRTWLYHELEHRLTPADDEDQAPVAELVDGPAFWREAPTSEHRNDGLYPFVFRQDDDGALMLHSVAGDTEHDHVTSDEPRTFITAARQYGPLVRCDANGKPLDEGQADAAEGEAGQ
ncbi:hypothetical protein ACIRG5_42435 [Lentzea sp. NPDC102401]|uniref:hypothetical protein n=1 Tax=Lentzea sp. NPDC102401 TaxID=3364128 RepID=UPI0037FCA2E9